MTAAGLTGLAALGAGSSFWARSATAQEGDTEFLGSWIRRPDAPGVPGDGAGGNNMSRLSYARTEVPAAGEITQAIAIAAATHQYELWINGQRADFGQSFNHADRQYYQTTDVTEYLRSGESNGVGVRYHWYGGGQGRPVDQPGAFVQLHIAYADGTEDIIGTDETWRMRNAEWLAAPSRGGCAQDRQEWIDARLHPNGWSEPGFDDSDWIAPTVIGRHPAGIWETLNEAEARITEKWAEPASVTRLDSGAYVVDFGKVVAGHPYVRFHDGRDGRVITMRAGYRLVDQEQALQILDDEWLRVTGGGVTLSKDGDDWGDQIVEMTVRQVQGGVGWMFRAPNRNNGYMWQLGGSGGSGQLRMHTMVNGNFSLIDSVSLDLNPGTPYRVRVEAIGSQIRTFIDDELIDERDDGTFANGRIGFREASNEIGEFDDVVVTAPDGTVLLADDFSGALSAWELPGAEVSTSSRDNQRVNMSYQLIQKDGENEFLPYHYLGFRYFQVDDPGEELAAADFKVKMRYSKVPEEDAATFKSSNPMVDAVFELCRHSALHGGQEQWVDTPTREKGGFLGDALLISYVSMRAFGERALTRQGLREFKQSQERFWLGDPNSPIYGIVNAVYPTRDGARDIADYTQQYLTWAWWYYWETGDVAMLEELHETCRHITEYVARHVDDDSGLIINLSDAGRNSAYRFGIVDWPSYGRYGFPFPNNPNTVEDARITVNVFGVMVFRLMAQISEVLSRPQSEIDLDRQREAALTEAINTHMIGPDGYYVSVVRRTDGELVQLEHAGQHANSYPLAFGIVPENNRQAVIDRIVELRILQGPMTCHWLLDAIEEADLPHHLVDILTDASIPGWAAIMSRGATFTWESWEVDNPSIPVSGTNSAGDSQSHPWGAVALIAIQRQLLGVRITSPGAATLDIKPAVDVLEHARGDVPTERGTVHVQWRQLPNGGATVQVRVPDDVAAVVYLPHVDGIRYHGAGRGRPRFVGIEDGREVFEVGSGPSNFVARRD
jgi:hypothetical protein